MATPARSRSSDTLGGDLGPAALKGGVLVFVALVLGIVLLLQGTSTDLDAASPDGDEQGTDGDNGTPGTTDDTATDGTTDTTAAATTTTAGEARPPDEVTVLLANASGIPGAATEVGTALAAQGYLIADPDNATVSATTSIVYYIPGFEAEARAVATALGLDPDAEGIIGGEVPSPVPTQDASMGAANILVILGPDVAPTTSGGATTTAAGTGSE